MRTVGERHRSGAWPERGERQRNGFDTLRLLGALIVLIGHAFIITGVRAPSVGSIPLHSFGVCIFFAISGYLITQSWMSDPDWLRYLSRRLLRILPALVVVAVTTALVIGAYASTEPLADYYRHGWTWRYVLSNAAMVTVWSLPGVFSDLPLAGQVNSSLWTIPIEFGLYIIAPGIVLVHRRAPVSGAVSVLLVSAVVATLFSGSEHLHSLNIAGIDVGRGAALAPYFWLGALLRLSNLHLWSPSARRAAGIASASMFAVWAAAQSQVLLVPGMVSITVLVLLIGLSERLHSHTLERIGDLSYGTYLWAFPVQQLVMAEAGGGPMRNLTIAGPVTLALAYGSWHLIERPTLRWKPKRRIHPELEVLPLSSDAALQSPPA
jgi:peptidoglycan/LPS O-acetylase OafA/YrhL